MSCPDCYSGSIHSGTPKGRVETIHGRPTYVAEPGVGKPVKGIVVIAPDAFGWEFLNNRILADHYAEKGSYLVYLPDFMDGHAAPVWLLDTTKGLISNSGWLYKPYQLVCCLYGMAPFLYFNSVGKAWPKVQSFFEAVRLNEGSTLPIGISGFCWGGKHAFIIAQGQTAPNGKPLIDAAFTAHPSFLKIPDDVVGVKKPVSVAIGDKDNNIKPPQIEVIKQILENEVPVSGEVKVYPGAGHGFGIRADMVLDDSAKQADEAADQALDWFNRHFSQVEY